jgi:hypothetical protein
MKKCIQCGKSGEILFRVIEIRTLHIRDFTGEKFIQNIGSTSDYAVCLTCARTCLDGILNNKEAICQQCIVFNAVLLVGIVMTYIFFYTDGALRLFGLSAIVCGALGLFSLYRGNRSRRKTYEMLNEDSRLEKAAWEYLLTVLPGKKNEVDLTYIPVNEETQSLKNGDLMILYHLLPEIAVKVYMRIHGTNKKNVGKPAV